MMRVGLEFDGVGSIDKAKAVVATVEHVAAESAIDVLTLQSLEVPIVVAMDLIEQRAGLVSAVVDDHDGLTITMNVAEVPSDFGELDLDVATHGLFSVDLLETGARMRLNP